MLAKLEFEPAHDFARDIAPARLLNDDLELIEDADPARVSLASGTLAWSAAFCPRN